MSFMVQARLEYHRQVQQVRFTTRTYDMLTGQRITLADIFPADSPAWTLISQTVRDTANAYYPDETPDAAAVEALCENLAQADFMLYGMSLVIPLILRLLFHCIAMTPNCSIFPLAICGNVFFLFLARNLTNNCSV